jgi:hypothetical protein
MLVLAMAERDYQIPSAKPAGTPTGPARAVPTAPRKPATPGPAANGEAKANGTASPSVTAPSGTDPKVLRQKLEEARARNASANAARGDAKYIASFWANPIETDIH